MAVHRMVEKMSSLKIKTPTYQITTNYFIKRTGDNPGSLDNNLIIFHRRFPIFIEFHYPHRT